MSQAAIVSVSSLASSTPTQFSIVEEEQQKGQLHVPIERAVAFPGNGPASPLRVPDAIRPVAASAAVNKKGDAKKKPRQPPPPSLSANAETPFLWRASPRSDAALSLQQSPEPPTPSMAGEIDRLMLPTRPPPPPLSPKRSFSTTDHPDDEFDTMTAGLASTINTEQDGAVAVPLTRAGNVYEQEATSFTLPASHINAHRAFLDACDGTIDPNSRDWNEEFQTTMTEWDSAVVIGVDSKTRLTEFLKEYEAHCKKLLTSILGDGAKEAASRAAVTSGCTRYGNLLVRVWRDSKLGFNYQRCFRALLECRMCFLNFPLVATFRFLDVSVSVQAVVPVDGKKPPLYRGDGAGDAVVHRPLRELLCTVQEALNLRTAPIVAPTGASEGAVALLPPQLPSANTERPPLVKRGVPPPLSLPSILPVDSAKGPPNGKAEGGGGDGKAQPAYGKPNAVNAAVAGAAKQRRGAPSAAAGGSAPVCAAPHTTTTATTGAAPTTATVAADAGTKLLGVEVYEGLDRRLYVVNPIGLLPAMKSVTGTRAVPLRRWQHLIRRQPQPRGPLRVEAYRHDVSNARGFLIPAISESLDTRQRRLVELLHANGLNVCLLGLLAQIVLEALRDTPTEQMEDLLTMVCVEMAARALRRMMCMQMSVDRCRWTVKAAKAYLERTVALMLPSTVQPPARMVDCLVPTLIDMFLFFGSADGGDAEVFTRINVTIRKHRVLVAKRLCQLSGLQITQGTVTSILLVPSKHNYQSYFSLQHSAMLAKLLKNEAQYHESFVTALVLPLRLSSQCRTGHVEAAWVTAKQLIAHRCTRLQQLPFLNIDTWGGSAMVAALCGEHEDCNALLARCREVLEKLPATVRVAPPSRGQQLPAQSSAHSLRQVAAPPRSLQYFQGRVRFALVLGHVLNVQGQYSIADDSFNEVLCLAESEGIDQVPFLAHIRLQAMTGLAEVAAQAGVDSLLSVNQRWEDMRHTIPPSQSSARVSDYLANLFLENELYVQSTVRFWECYSIAEALFGRESSRVAEMLNKIAYVYYRWGARLYWVYCSCMLHQAEEILINTCGLYSISHIGVVENIIALYIECGQHVCASRRLRELNKMPKRYTCHIPKDHPALLRFGELDAWLRNVFRDKAAQLIQQHWRACQHRQLVRGVCEMNANIIQRVGRGFMTRRLVKELRTRPAAMSEIRRRQLIPVFLSASKPLINGSAMFSKVERNWNGELQLARVYGVWWDSVDGKDMLHTMRTVEAEFEAQAKECVRLLKTGLASGRRVAQCSTSVVMNNMVLTRVPKDDLFSIVQHKLLKRFRTAPQKPVTAPLSAIVRCDTCDYFAIALLPLHWRPLYTFTSEGRSGPQSTDVSLVAIDELLREFRAAGLTQYDMEHMQGLEIVKASDELYYTTNALGLVSDFIRQGRDANTLEVPEGPFSRAVYLCLADKAKEAVEMIEHFMLSYQPKYPSGKVFFFTLLAGLRYAAGLDANTSHQLLSRASAALEEDGNYILAVLCNVKDAQALMRRDLGRLAVDTLMRSLYLIREKTRVHPYFGAQYVLETAHLLLVASQSCERSVELSVFKSVIKAVKTGEPSVLLFTTCERFIQCGQREGLTSVVETLSELRDIRAKQITDATSKRYVKKLQEESEELFRRGGSTAYQESMVNLLTAIHIARRKKHDAHTLGSLLTSYGYQLTMLNRLSEASKYLAEAYRALSKEYGRSSAEMRVWRKNHGILKHRQEQNAYRIIRRAVRRWKEQRRLYKEMALTSPEEYEKVQQLRVRRLLVRLMVREATARVLLCDEETEERYQLERRQFRMRQTATLQQTYSARVQLMNDKLVSAQNSLIELAVATKQAIWELGWSIRQSILTNMLLNGRRLGRRPLLQDMQEARFELYQWHIISMDEVVRMEFWREFSKLHVRILVAEESMWRHVIKDNQRAVKRQLGRCIAKRQRHLRTRDTFSDLRDLDHAEERWREAMWRDEEQAFARLMEEFVCGEVVKEPDDY